MRGWILIGFVLFSRSTAFAHHDGQVGRIDPTLRTLAPSGLPPAGTFRFGAAYGFSRFGRFLDGRETLDEDGEVEVQLLTLTGEFFLAQKTSLSLELPLGRVEAKGEQTDSALGLGDVSFAVRHGLTGSESPFTVTLHGGMILPTGRYEPEESLSVSELETTPDGGLDLVTFDTRASLGADVFALRAGVDASVTWGAWTPILALSVLQPLTETEDEIRWGADLGLRGGARFNFGRAVQIGGFADYRKHLRDRLDVAGADESIERRRVGGRDDLGVVAELNIALSDATLCGAALRLPVWQRTGAIQLVETFSLSASCALQL